MKKLGTARGAPGLVVQKAHWGRFFKDWPALDTDAVRTLIREGVIRNARTPRPGSSSVLPSGSAVNGPDSIQVGAVEILLGPGSDEAGLRAVSVLATILRSMPLAS